MKAGTEANEYIFLWKQPYSAVNTKQPDFEARQDSGIYNYQ
jgi:hypothetical protein